MVGRTPRKQPRRTFRRIRKVRRGSFLNRYDFAYAERDTVNQAFKDLNSTAPGLMKQLTDQVHNVAEQRIRQVLDQDSEKIEKIAPKIIRGAIEDVYQTPFRLLGKFS